MGHASIEVYEFGTTKVEYAHVLAAVKDKINNWLFVAGPDEWLDLRLHVGNEWKVYTGNPQYDLDHQGAWGDATFIRGDRPEDIARELLEGAANVWDEIFSC